MSGLVNKAKAAMHSDKSTSNTHHDNPQSTNAGPHGSNMMNTVDPRVDSDRDHRNDPLSSAGGKGHVQQGHAGGVHPAGTHNAGTTGGLTSHTAGTHTGAHTAGTHTGTHAGTHSTGTATHGTHGTHGSSVTPGSGTATNAGPHNSAMMNKLDPRVDSDLNGSKTTGGNATMR